MSWQIVCNTDYIEYLFDNNEENPHLTGYLAFASENSYQEESGEYKAPKDDVVTQVYTADSDHGVFIWKVTARRSGFNTYAEIEDVYLIEAPENCETLDSPRFSIKESD